MEVSDEADHLRFARVGTGEAECEVRGFRAGGREAHTFGAGNEALHKLCPAHLEFMRGAPVRALRDLLLHGCNDRRMHVPKKKRAVAAEIIDVFVAIDIPLERTGGTRRIDRIWQQGT